MSYLGFTFAFLAMLFAASFQQPAVFGGPYDNTLNLDSYLANGITGDASVYGAPGYFRLYWTANTTHIRFGVVCRIVYPAGNDPFGVTPQANSWCGFGFSASQGLMFAPGDTSDSVVAHLEGSNVIVEDFRLSDKRINPIACSQSSNVRGACRDIDYLFNDTSRCASNIQNPGGSYSSISTDEAYLTFGWTRILTSPDRFPCDKNFTLGTPVNFIYSIGFANNGPTWPYNIGAPGAFTAFFHSTRGPSVVAGITPPYTITFNPTTTTGEVTTAIQTTGLQTTGLTTVAQTTSLQTTVLDTTSQQTTVRVTTARITTSSSPVNSSAPALAFAKPFGIAALFAAFLALLF